MQARANDVSGRGDASVHAPNVPVTPRLLEQAHQCSARAAATSRSLARTTGENAARKPLERHVSQLVERKVERVGGVSVLDGEGGAAHQTIVGVEDDVHTAIVVRAQWMLSRMRRRRKAARCW